MNAIVPGPFEGELLGAGDTVRVVIAPHPLKHERHTIPMPAGATIAELVDNAVAITGTRWAGKRFTVYLEGYPVPQDRWRLVRPKPGTTIAMRPVPTEPFSAIFAAISGAIGAFKSFIAAAGIFGKLLMAGISFGVKLLLNALFAPKPTTQERIEAKASYSISGSRNQATPFGPIPVILGTHRVAPPYAAPPYTEVVGDEQYLRLLFCVGYGPLSISDIKIGETPIDSFDDVNYEVRQGFDAEAQTGVYPFQVQEEQLGIELTNADGYQRRTTAASIKEIAIDIVWPRGLIYVTSKGKRLDHYAKIAWRYRLVGAVSWTEGPFYEINASTQDTIRRTLRVAVAEGQYEVEVIKASADLTPPSGDSLVENVQWTALRGFRTGEPITTTDNVAVIGVRIKATNQLNGTVDTLNCIATSLVTSWNGASWVADTASSNPADLFRHVLECQANRRPVAGGRFDTDALQDWHDYCASAGWTFNKPVAQQVSVYDMLREIAAAGRAMPVFKDGKWSVVWDEQDTPIVQMFTPRNSWGFEAQHRYEELPHAFRIRFVNDAKGYIDDERIVYDDGYSAANATRFEGIDFPGVTDADLNWKHGRYHIAQLRLRPATYTLNVDFEGLVLTRGDRVRVQHDVMLVGLNSGRVVEIDAGDQTVTVDETLTMPSGASMLRFRLADGTFLTRNVASSASGELTVIPLDGTGDLPAVGDLFAFGLSGAESAIYRVLGIEPRNDHVHRLTLVDDAPAINDADTGTIPDFESNVTAPVDPFTLPPTDIYITESVHGEGGEFFAALKVSWRLPRLGRVSAVEVEYQAAADGIWRRVASVGPQVPSAEIRNLDPGHYKARVRCLFDDGTFSAWNTSAVFAALALLDPPDDVQDFRIDSIGDISTLSWSAMQGAGITYQVRFAPSDVASPGWNAATPLLPSVSGTSAQVPTLIGTFYIKAMLPVGTMSSNATSIVTGIAALAGLNVIETLTEHPGFAGSRDGVEAIEDELRLLANNTMDKWESLDDVVSLYAGDGDDDALGYAVEGTYVFDGSIDLGAVYTSRVTAIVDAYGFDPANSMSRWTSLADLAVLDTTDAADWDVLLEYRSTDVNPALSSWSAWKQFVVGDITARALEFRLTLTGRRTEIVGLDYAVTTPVVRGLAVKIDMPDEIRAGDDLTVPVSGLTVSFSPALRQLEGLAIAAQDLATGDRAVITAKSATGFDIIFRDSGGSAVERTFDYVAKGWGRIAA